MDEANVCNQYSPLNETRSMFNNPKQSDVCFLVEDQKVYGHRLILSMGSPVFYSMFYGDLKEDQDTIEIKDVSFVGFRNALKYIYGFPIDFELFELNDSYLAADRYLLHHFNEAFFGYIKSRLNAMNSCLIYDQLMKLQQEEISLAHVRNMITRRSKKAFESDHFTQIGQETLISLLLLDELSISELDLLAAVSKWVDCEVQRQGLAESRENRRKVFEPIKSYLLFTALTPEQIANFKVIVELLTSEERGSLVLYSFNKSSPLVVELKTPRKAGISVCYSVFVENSFFSNSLAYSRWLYLKVNREVLIQKIYLTYSAEKENVNLVIRDSNDVALNLVMKKLVKDGKLGFSFSPTFCFKPNSKYKLIVNGDGELGEIDQVSKQLELKYKESIVFNLEFGTNFSYHCVRGLEFFPSD